MRLFRIIAVAIVIVFSMIACGDDSPDSSPSAPEAGIIKRA